MVSVRAFFLFAGFAIVATASAAPAASPDEIRSRVQSELTSYSAHFPELASPLDSGEFRHPAEMDCISTLMNANPGIRDLIDDVKRDQLRQVKDKEELFRLSGVEVGPSQYPSVYAAAQNAAKALGLNAPFALFITNNPEMQDNVFGFIRHAHVGNGFGRYLIMLTAGLAKALTPDELQFAIGREMGHVKANHRFYTALAFEYQKKKGLLPKIFAEDEATKAEGLGGTLTLLFNRCPAPSRISEYSADRAGLIAVGKREVALSALAKLARGDLEGTPGFDLDSYLTQVDAASHDTTPKDVADLVAAEGFMPYVLNRIGELNRFSQSEDFKRLLARESSDPFLLEAEDLALAGGSLVEYTQRLTDFRKDPKTARLDPMARAQSEGDLMAKIQTRQKASAELTDAVVAHVDLAGLTVDNALLDDLIATVQRHKDARPFAGALSKLNEQIQFALTQQGVSDAERAKLTAHKAAIDAVRSLAPAARPKHGHRPDNPWVEAADLPSMLSKAAASLADAAASDGRESFFARLDDLAPQLKATAIKIVTTMPIEQRAQIADLITNQSGHLAHLVGEVSAAGTDEAKLGAIFDQNFDRARDLLKTVPLFVIKRALADYAPPGS